MNFELTVDQRSLASSIAEMLKSELTPELLREIAYGSQAFSRILWNAISLFGLPGLVVSENFGGAGLGFIEAVIAIQQAGYTALPAPLQQHLVATLVIQNSCNETLKQQWLPKLASGNIIAGCGFETTSSISRDATRCSLPWTGFSKDADVLLVSSLEKGIGIVDLRDTDVSMSETSSIDLTRPSQHVVLPRDAIQTLAGPTSQNVESAWRILLASDSWGITQYVLNTTCEYANTRRQFGRLIGEFQSVKHPLAEAAMNHKFAESLLWSSASQWESANAGYEESALLCKAHVTELAISTIRVCIQLMGAYGFTWESDLHLWLKRAMFNAHHLGSPAETRSMLATVRGWR